MLLFSHLVLHNMSAISTAHLKILIIVKLAINLSEQNLNNFLFFRG